jgi:hypothetical protein
MVKGAVPPKIRVPRDRPRRFKLAKLHAISLDQYALAYTCSWAATDRIARVRLEAQNDLL